jgi:hypothetical protein
MIRIRQKDVSAMPALPAPPPPEPLPPRVAAFWNFDEDAHRARTPWRYAESPDEQAIREDAENRGCWTG